MVTNRSINLPVILALPEGFSITTNTGLHGDMQFFEVSEDHQMTATLPIVKEDSEAFAYYGHDSDEGCVVITYVTICGSPADSPDVEGWDVEISSGSDVWGLTETSTAIRDAIKLHKALGRDKAYRE